MELLDLLLRVCSSELDDSGTFRQVKESIWQLLVFDSATLPQDSCFRTPQRYQGGLRLAILEKNSREMKIMSALGFTRKAPTCATERTA
jgi:hypothetical protein